MLRDRISYSSNHHPHNIYNGNQDEDCVNDLYTEIHADYPLASPDLYRPYSNSVSIRMWYQPNFTETNVRDFPNVFRSILQVFFIIKRTTCTEMYWVCTINRSKYILLYRWVNLKSMIFTSRH